MNRTRAFAFAALVIASAAALWMGWPRNESSALGSQRYEVLADAPIDLNQVEQRELLTLVLQKLGAFGTVRSALKPEIAIPEFAQPTPRTTLLLLQHQKGKWNEPKARQDLLRIIDQISQRLGKAPVRTGLVTKLPFPNRVPVALKDGRCWRLKAGNAQDLALGIRALKEEVGDRLWSVDDLPDELALEALALRMELYTKSGEAALVFSGREVDDLDVRAARLRLQAIDCGRNGAVEMLPFLIEEFHGSRFTALTGKGWLSTRGDRLLIAVDLPEGIAEPRWSELIEVMPHISVHPTGGVGTVQLTPATALHDHLDFSFNPTESMRWMSSAGSLIIEVDPGLESAQLNGLPMPQGWRLKLYQPPPTHP